MPKNRARLEHTTAGVHAANAWPGYRLCVSVTKDGCLGKKPLRQRDILGQATYSLNTIFAEQPEPAWGCGCVRKGTQQNKHNLLVGCLMPLSDPVQGIAHPGQHDARQR